MELYIILLLFIVGTIFGSFFNVVGDRLPRGESIVFPPSHCNSCNHRLTALELIPVLSYLFQGGKCKKCKAKLSIVYPLYEIFCGAMFVATYLSFGPTADFIIALTFVSMLLIIFISDISYMIIPDEVLITTLILLIIEMIAFNGLSFTLSALLNGLIAGVIMLLLKFMGDFLFKKESMGGGDIKLLFFFGMVIDWPMAILTIFMAAFIALPVAITVLVKKKDHQVPFGPFLNIAAMIILFTHIDINMVLNFLNVL